LEVRVYGLTVVERPKLMPDTRNISVQNHGYAIELPDACPICHRYSELQIILADVIDRGTKVQVIYRCAYQGCQNFFLGYYGQRGQPALLSVKPIKSKASYFPASISKISPTFVAVFAEAEEAALSGLSQIAGPGYRKAFEFLIKDYAVKLAPDKAEDIRQKFSGAVVTDYIPDPRIQAVARRSLWLGNDETHYLRKWANHDVDDLVTLIKLTANWIEIDELSKSYVQQMPE
jgi:hypothetical protein